MKPDFLIHIETPNFVVVKASSIQQIQRAMYLAIITSSKGATTMSLPAATMAKVERKRNNITSITTI
jgi:hypothetical protein